MLLVIHRRLASVRDEGGSALVAVIGVLAVTLIVTALISTSIVHAIGFTTSTRANVQSQAAAEAGIAVAQASLLSGNCTTGVYESTDPEYRVVVSYVVGGAVMVGCPPSSVSEVRILATGTAANSGVGMAAGDESTVEAVYVASASGVPASGAAIFAYSAIGFGESGHLVSTDGHEATVHLVTDTLTCNGGAGIDASVVVANGNVEIGGSCPIGGSVWAGGYVSLSGNPHVAGGTIVATGDATIVGDHTVNVWAGGTLDKGYGTITGTLVSGGNATIAGNLNGTLWASGTVTRNSWPTVNGDIIGTALLNGGNHNGTFHTLPGGPARPATPVIPSVPDWIDFDYTMAHWPGYALATINGNCDFAKIQAAVDSLAGGPGVIDARSCTNPFTITSDFKLPLHNDTVIVANRFMLSAGGGFTSNNPVSLWLITPDEVANGLPTCTPAKDQFEISGGFTVGPQIKTLAYTPCRVSIININITWRGQIFAGATTISASATLDFTPVGLPGYDLSTGGPSGGSAGSLEELLQKPTVVRNTSGG